MYNCSLTKEHKQEEQAMTAIGLLIARLIVGMAMAAHGSQKAFGWFGGYGLKGTGGFFESMGYRPGVLFAALAAYGEIAGGILTALGLFGPIGPALIVLVMVVAAGSTHLKNGFFASKNGFELNAFYVASALALTFGGPGALSLDGVLGLEGYFSAPVNATAIGAGFIIGLISLALRRTAHQRGTHAAPRPAA
jgi:putative oxidoreductase